MKAEQRQFDPDRIDTLLLDMDGTVLDLAFDNYFWLQHLPAHLADRAGIEFDEAAQRMRAHTARVYGQLQWYCIDYWSEQLDLDVAAIKHDVRHRIGYLAGALEFLQVARAAGLRLVLVTNAHRRTLAVKLGQTHLDRFVDEVHSSHDFGVPKESEQFWPQFEQASGIAPERSVLIDDSQPVIDAGRAFGLGAAVIVSRPDSGQAARDAGKQAQVAALADLQALIR